MGGRKRMRVLGPCVKCGSTERYSDGKGDCMQCAKVRREAKYRRTKDKVFAETKAWALANPDKKAAISERSRLKKYGMTPQQHQAILEEQKGLCRICKETLGRVHIDHDHKTGAVRGLLCHKCNVGLGHFRDDPALLREAAIYLEAHREEVVTTVRHRATFRPNDRRFKVSDAVLAEMQTLRSQGCSFGVIGKKLGLSRSWVYLTLKAISH